MNYFSSFLRLSASLAAALALSACGQSTPAPVDASVAADNGAAMRVQDAVRNDIRLLQAGPARVTQQLTLYGVVVPNAYAVREIRARYPGVVQSVAKKPGQVVARGDVLLSVESSQSLSRYVIRAPIAGVVLERRVNPGESADTSRVLMVIANLDTVWAQFQVFARDIGRVRAHQPVAVKATSAGTAGQARLDYVAPVGDADSRSVVARATLDNRDRRWVPGQFLTGNITVAAVKAAVAVVPEALQRVDGKTVVFAVDGNRFVPRVVRTGLRDAVHVEIRAGLEAGTRYAADNSYLIKAEQLKDAGGEE